jgi:hypothetical protein
MAVTLETQHPGEYEASEQQYMLHAVWKSSVICYSYYRKLVSTHRPDSGCDSVQALVGGPQPRLLSITHINPRSHTPHFPSSR